ncbi:MAG: LamG domain-containing protein [Alphaproteobacteria bacterium]|nr:LamG domain-containing protein [Alphaproteobacteria bacterium]
MAPVTGYHPVAYWKLDGQSASAVDDEMGNHPGQVFGKPEDADVSFLADAVFDGIDDYIRVSSNADLMARNGTLTAWFFAFDAGSGTIAARGAPGDEGHFALSIQEGHLQVLMCGADADHVVDGGEIKFNEWNQSTVTWGAGGVKTYLNGAPKGNGEYAGGLQHDTPWCFGATEGADGTPGVFFQGELDDIALYTEQLSETEVRDLCQVGIEGVMTGEGSTEVDSSLDFSTIPTAYSGPESLGTLDVTPLDDKESIDHMLDGLSAPIADLDSDGEVEPEPEPESEPESVPPEEATPENSPDQAISFDEEGDLTIKGGEKLQW